VKHVCGASKSLTSGFMYDVFRTLLAELSRLDNRAPLDVERDLAYAERRFANEGIDFLTSRLSELGRAFKSSLATDGPLVVPLG